MITIEQAIQNIIDIKNMYTWSTGAEEALDMAIQALTREDKIRQMLESEKKKVHCRYVEYRDGRISAFYDALGVNYAD